MPLPIVLEIDSLRRGTVSRSRSLRPGDSLGTRSCHRLLAGTVHEAHAGRGRRLTSASQGEPHFSAAATNTGVDRLRRIDVFNVRGGEVVDEALRIAVDQPLSVKRRTISTFSSDIAYSERLAASRAVGSRVSLSFGVSVSSFSASFRPRQRYRKPAGHRPSSE
jgi:hypothetical protein